MIKFTFDHSYAEDYFALSYVDVDIKDEKKKEKVEDKIKLLNIGGMVEYPDRHLKKKLAEFLEVDVSEIDFDTEEIDLM